MFDRGSEEGVEEEVDDLALSYRTMTDFNLLHTSVLSSVSSLLTRQIYFFVLVAKAALLACLDREPTTSFRHRPRGCV